MLHRHQARRLEWGGLAFPACRTQRHFKRSIQCQREGCGRAYQRFTNSADCSSACFTNIASPSTHTAPRARASRRKGVSFGA